MESGIYRGSVRHRRMKPIEHSFRYPIFMMYLDLSEINRIFRGRWLWSMKKPSLAWLCRKDHLGDPKVPLEQAVRDLVENRTGMRPQGPVRLLTHLRYFGYCFNPVSFYYCFDLSGEHVETIVAEVYNTPWGERHCYVLDEKMNEGEARTLRYRFAKEFHVSPFMPMELTYDWRLTIPGKNLVVHMENKMPDKIFDATLCLDRQEITGISLAMALISYPLMTLHVSAAIYFQALKLWMKKSPFFPHPHKRKSGVGIEA